MQFRVDPVNVSGGDIAIDYFRLEGDYSNEKVTDVVIDNTSHITKSDSEVSWEFETNGPFDGWACNNQLGDIYVNDGQLNATIAGPSPELQSCGDLKLDTSKIGSIKILFKNNTLSSDAKLYFVTDESPNWLEEQCFKFNTVKKDTAGTRYIINTSDNPLWKGTLKGLKFAPTQSRGSISIDYIRMEISE